MKDTFEAGPELAPSRLDSPGAAPAEEEEQAGGGLGDRGGGLAA